MPEHIASSVENLLACAKCVVINRVPRKLRIRIFSDHNERATIRKCYLSQRADHAFVRSLGASLDIAGLKRGQLLEGI